MRPFGTLWRAAIVACLFFGGASIASWSQSPPDDQPKITERTDTTLVADDSIGLSPQVAASASPLPDFKVPSGPTCPPPEWTWYGVSFTTVKMVDYTERFGWGIRAGLALEDRRGGHLHSAAVYSVRDHRWYFWEELETPLLTRGQMGIAGSQSAFYNEGKRGIRLGLGLSLVKDPPDRPWLSADADFCRYDYFRLNWIGHQDWYPGEMTEFSVGLTYDDWHRPGRPFRGLAAGFWGILGSDLLGGDFVYRRAGFHTAWPHRLWAAWMQLGIMSGRVPVQDLFDLPDDGEILGLPFWQYRGKKLWATGAELRLRAFRSLFAFPFVGAAGLPDQEFDTWEAGLGVGLSPRGADVRPTWRVRIDVPFYNATQTAGRDRWDLRRISVRIRLSASPFGGPDYDYRYP